MKNNRDLEISRQTVGVIGMGETDIHWELVPDTVPSLSPGKTDTHRG